MNIYFVKLKNIVSIISCNIIIISTGAISTFYLEGGWPVDFLTFLIWATDSSGGFTTSQIALMIIRTIRIQSVCTDILFWKILLWFLKLSSYAHAFIKWSIKPPKHGRSVFRAFGCGLVDQEIQCIAVRCHCCEPTTINSAFIFNVQTFRKCSVQIKSKLRSCFISVKISDIFPISHKRQVSIWPPILRA